MTPDLSGFLGPGAASVTRAIDSPAQWTVIDELGYLESSCPEFCDAVFRLFDRKRVIAVLRSQSTPFLDALRARDDVFVYDLTARFFLSDVSSCIGTRKAVWFQQAHG